MPRALPHFKVFTSAKNHRRLAEVYGDNDLLALWLRLGVEAIERFADRTDDSFIVRDRELLDLTGRGRADVARKLLERLADVSPISAQRKGDVWRITFPNLAKKQFGRSRNGSETDASSTSAPTSTPTPIESVSPPSAGAPKRSPMSRRGLPEAPPEAVRFAVRFRENLASVYPKAKAPSDFAFTSWIDAARLMLDGDGRKLEDMEELATWLFRDPGESAAFWRANILSLPKFRERFDQLAAQRQRPSTRGRSQVDALREAGDRIRARLN